MNVLLRNILKAFNVLVLLFLAGGMAFPQTDEIPAAISELSSPDKEVRLRAVYTLGKAKDDERSVEPLIRSLKDPDDWIREGAAGTLGFRKEARAVRALIPLLKDKSDSVRYTTAGALGNISDPIAVEPLIEYLIENPKPHGGMCNYAAVQALGKFNDERAVKPLFSYIGKECGSGIPEAIGSAGVESMVEIVKTGSATERERAVWVLLHIADERALDALISVLGINENSVGYNAVSAIALRIGRPAIDPLRSAFKSGDIELKKKIVLTLAKIDDEQIGSVLVELVTNNEAAARREVVNTLADLNTNGYGPEIDHVIVAILAAMKDKDAEIRNLAIRALAREERDDVFQAMVDALSDPATSAEASLVVGARKDLRALSHLLIALKGEEPYTAARAAQVLTGIRNPSVDGLISVLTDRDKEFPLREIRRRGERANASFMFRCGSEPPDPILDPRVLAANALGEIGDDRARKPLTEALKDKAEWLREAAAAALGKLDK